MTADSSALGGKKLMWALVVALVCALAGGTSQVALAGPDAGESSATAAKKKKKCKKGKKRVGRKCVKRTVPTPPAAVPLPPAAVPSPTPPPAGDDVVDDSATINEDSGAAPIPVLANDSPGTTIASKTDGAHGTVAITGGGTGLTYMPAANYCNTPPGPPLDTFTYTSTGGDMATVTVTVNCVNDLPMAVDDGFNLGIDSGPTEITFAELLVNDTDVDGPSALTITQITNQTEGSFVVNMGEEKITFTPDNGFCGDTGFDYTLSDGGPVTDTGHVNIQVGDC